MRLNMEPKKRSRFFAMPLGYDKYIHYSVLLLALFGTIMVVSASMTITSTTLDLVIVGAKQIIYIVAGLFGMVYLANHFSFDYVRKHIVGILAFTVGSLLFTLIFPAVGGAQAWIRIPFPGTEITIQPSEFAKLVAILTLAVYFGDLPKKVAQKASDIMGPPILSLVGIFLVILVLQRDIGTAVVFFVICFFVFLLPSHRKLSTWQRPALILSGLGSAFLIFMMSDPGIAILKTIGKGSYQIQRFLAAYNPFEIAQEGGYQIVNSLIAMVRGNWFGVVLGRSLQKYGYLPAARTDFILAILVEETGMLGFTTLMILYGILVYRLVRGALRSVDEKSKMVLVGILLYILVHFVLNVGGVTAMIPLTGVPLLFISQGGSSTMAILCGLGIVQNILAKQQKAKQP
jgi:cell division protein FtsW